MFVIIAHNVRITQQVVLSPFYLKYKPSDYFTVLKVLTLKIYFNKR
jgi:hypothetical protein